MSIVHAIAGLLQAGSPASTAPAFKASALNVASGATGSRTVTISGVADDLWIAWAFMDDSASFTTDPASWTLLTPAPFTHTGGANTKMRVWYRYLTGSVSNPVFTEGSSNSWGVGLVSITGANASTPIDGIATANTEVNTTGSTCPTFTTTVANTLILRLYGRVGLPPTADSGYPSSHTGIFVQPMLGTGSLSLGAAYQTQAGIGATGTALFTPVSGGEGADRVLAVTVAVRPA
jgi:hypothetical protein